MGEHSDTLASVFHCEGGFNVLHNLGGRVREPAGHCLGDAAPKAEVSLVNGRCWTGNVVSSNWRVLLQLTRSFTPILCPSTGAAECCRGWGRVHYRIIIGKLMNPPPTLNG